MANLEDLYREIVLDHYKSPRNRGELPVPPAHQVEGINPLCGDEITVYLELDDGTLRDIKVSGQGCSISQASSSLMSAAVKGKPLSEVERRIGEFRRMMTSRDSDGEEAEAVDLNQMGEIAALQGVTKFPARIKCALLAWTTLEQGLVEMGAGA
jgi:nitrogen fixation protein NifU and related proteins